MLDRVALVEKVALEQRHWWYRGRSAVLRSALERLDPIGGGPVLDAGCGTGHNLDLLARFGRVGGVDLNRRAVELARRRGMDAHPGSVQELPFGAEQFALVACLDVLEHAPDDAQALRELHRVARPGALLLLTVPAYPALFGEHDVAAGHLRRYRAPYLLELTARAGWRRLILTHFNSLLLPAAVLARRRERDHGGRPRSDLLRTPAYLDGALSWPMRLEARLIKAGVDLPAGLSLLLAAVRA